MKHTEIDFESILFITYAKSTHTQYAHVHALAIFLEQYYDNHNPEFIFFKESFYLFNIFYDQFSENEYYQLSTLVLVAKDRALKIGKDESIYVYS